MKRHDEVASVAKELYERSGKIEGRDLENWDKAERIIMARYSAEEETSDENSKVRTSRKKTGIKEGKEPDASDKIKKHAVSPLRKSPTKSRAVEHT